MKTSEFTITAQMRHADLWKAVNNYGSASALADHLGLTPTYIGRLINLQTYPKHRNEEELMRLEFKLHSVTGKTLEELWPDELRCAIDQKELTTRVEITKTIEIQQLTGKLLKELACPSPNEVAIAQESIDVIEKILSTLKPRTRNVIEWRMGINGPVKTLEEIGNILGISKDRVRQIEERAIRDMRNFADRNHLEFHDIRFAK